MPKTYGESRMLITFFFALLGVALMRLFFFNDAETSAFENFVRGQSGLNLAAMLASSVFWKALAGFALGGTGGFFLARELPSTPESDLIARRAAIFLAVVIIYIPAMSAGFIWDDDQEITANTSLQNFHGLAEVWGGTKSADYFPLKTTMLWLEYRFWGLSPQGYHVVNILLHGIDALLVGLVLERLLIPGAWLAALFFAVHPVHVESVAWIAERKNTLSLFFYLLSLLAYFNFERTSRARSYVNALLCFLAALLCKTHVVVLPFVLLLCAWWQHGFAGMRRDPVEDENERRMLKMTNAVVGVVGIVAGIAAAIYLSWLNKRFHANPNDEIVVATNMFREGSLPPLFWVLAAICIGSGIVGLAEGVFAQRLNRHLVRTLAFFQIAVLLGVVTVWFQYGRAIGTEVIPIGEFPRRLANAGGTVWWYLTKAIAPINLIEIYPKWSIGPTSFVDFVPDITLVLLVVVLWWSQRIWGKGPLFAMLYFIVTLLPVMGFLKMSYMRLTLVADHFQYLSDISIIALFCAAGVELYRRCFEPWRPVLIGACALLLTTFCAYSWERAGVNQGEQTLWTDTLKKNWDSWQAHNHLGAVLYMQGKYDEAMEHFRLAVKMKPENPESHNNLGLTYAIHGDFPRAIAEYRRAIEIKDDPAMRLNLANALLQTKRYDEAIEQFRTSLQMNPNNPGAHCSLGYALAQTGQLDEAIKEFQEALKIAPDMQIARANLQMTLRKKAQQESGGSR